jgi:deoxycytidine triphosphate deaminase
MRLLTDAELKAKIDNLQPPLIEGMSTKDWQSKDSPIQPCSVDLHIGRIQVPAEDQAQPGPKISKLGDEHVLLSGATAVLTTSEVLHMSSSIAAIGFPPSHVSIKGLLMTNPGHVDPGYVGPMHFTVINMGRSPYALRIGDAICTVLFFELDSSPECDWRSRSNIPSGSVPPMDLRDEIVNRLASDFVDFRRIATEIADGAVTKAQWRAAIIASLISIGLVLISQFVPYYFGGIEELKKDYAVVSIQIESLKTDLTAVEAKQAGASGETQQPSRRSGTSK